MELNIRARRKRSGWTQEQLADLLGTSKSHVSEMESGKKNPSQPMLARLAQVFSVSLAEMLGGDIPPQGLDADVVRPLPREREVATSDGSFRSAMIEAMQEQGLSVADLSRSSGVGYDLINKLKRGDNRSTSAEAAAKIAQALGIESGAAAPVALVTAPGTDLVPVYNVAASAGPGVLVADPEEVVEKLAFPPGYLRSITSSNPRNLAIISVKGRSMEPTLRDDDVVMIDTSKTDLSYEGIFVIRDGGDSMLVKRISRASRRGYVMLVSDNRAHPEVERAVEDIQVIGKVVWAGVKM